MKEFFHKHKIAIFATGGILLLLYLFYRYEQNAAANAANTAATTTQPLNVGGTPLVYGTDSGAGGAGATSAGSGGVALGDYTGSTAQQIPNTSGSGVPVSSPNNAPTNALAPYVSIPSASTAGAAQAQPYNTVPVSQSQADQITAIAKAAVSQSSCAYALNGVNKTGVKTCGPGGYQFSGTGDLSTINPDVNGFFPGQPGYASAVEAQLQTTEQNNPQDTQDIANYESLLRSYGGIAVVGSSEGSAVPAGSNQTSTPVSNTAPVNNTAPANAYYPSAAGGGPVATPASTAAKTLTPIAPARTANLPTPTKLTFRIA